MTDFNPGIEARLHMIRENRGALCVVLDRAVFWRLDAKRAAAIVADIADQIGSDVAEAAAAKAGLDVREEGKKIADRVEAPTAVFAIRVDATMKIFNSTQPSLAAGLDKQPPAGCVRCVSIATGAATLLHCDVRTTAPIASA